MPSFSKTFIIQYFPSRPEKLDKRRCVSVGHMDTLLTQPALPERGQVPDEREGGVLDVCEHVHRKSSSWWENALQRLSDQTC